MEKNRQISLVVRGWERGGDEKLLIELTLEPVPVAVVKQIMGCPDDYMLDGYDLQTEHKEEILNLISSYLDTEKYDIQLQCDEIEED